MASCGRLSHLTRSQISQFQLLKFYSSSTSLKAVQKKEGSDEITIPYRIERSSTAILEALATTISKDYTAAHYKYEDDPYFIPASNITKRAFALSKESGKKAARYFLEKYPEYFVVNKSEPRVKAFDPPVVYTEDNVSSVEQLNECLQNFDVDNAINVYNILMTKGIEIGQESKQDLLELLCFYNNQPPLPEDYYEERFFQQEEPSQKKWNTKGMAEKLFEEMEKDSRAYSAMICGTVKFHNTERAISLYEEMQSNGVQGTIEAYNSMLAVVHLWKEDYETRWEQAIFLLHGMKTAGLKPNLSTMNNLLFLLSKSARWKRSRKIALSILTEMKSIGIEPSLGTYYHLILVFCSVDMKCSHILYEIMDELQGREFTIRHPSDVSFFVAAMEVAWKGVKDKNLVHRIHELLEFKKNSKLLGSALSEQKYFKCFFRSLCETEDVDKLMEVYEKFVPNTYTPEPSVTLSIINAIHFTGSYKHLPRLCSDVLLFEQSERANIMEILMEAAGCMKHSQPIQTDVINMVWRIVEKINSRSKFKRMQFDWSGAILGNILNTFLNGNDVEKSWSIVKQLREEELQIIGYPSKDTLLKFCEMCLLTDEYDKCSYCIKYAVKGSYPDFQADVENLVKDMFQQQKLKQKNLPRIQDILKSSSLLDDDSSSSSSESGSSSSDNDSSSSDSDNEANDEANGEIDRHNEEPKK